MRQLQPVIWSKGTFLSPQHLQAQERFVEDMMHFYLDSLARCPWGFSELAIDAKALSEGMLTMSAATGLFPDGLPFDVPASDFAPRSRSLQECFGRDRRQRTFYLAIPQTISGGLNVSMQRNSMSARFFAQAQTLRDENTGANEKPVQFARKNLQILADGESIEGSVRLPFARIEETDSGLFQMARGYVPPLLNIHASDVLNGMLRGLLEVLVARSAQSSRVRRQKNQALAEFTASDITNFWLLYTINTHLPALRHFFVTPSVHPEQFYRVLAELAGALTAFSIKVEPQDLPPYDHEGLGECFTRLEVQLRQLLETPPGNFVSLALKRLRDTIYAVDIDKDSYFEQSRFYLAVNAEMPEADLIRRVPGLLKVSSTNAIEHLVRAALPGAELRHLETPPRAIPVKLRHQYFSIERSGEAWDAIIRGRNLAVHAPSEFPNPEIELVILLPQAGN